MMLPIARTKGDKMPQIRAKTTSPALGSWKLLSDGRELPENSLVTEKKLRSVGIMLKSHNNKTKLFDI